MCYLWINMCDLQQVGTIGAFGSVLNMMVRPDLGDELLDGAVYGNSKLDDVFVIVRCSDERAKAVAGALEVIGNRKMRRKVRTRVTKNLPGKAWHWVYVRMPRQFGGVRGMRLPRMLCLCRMPVY